MLKDKIQSNVKLLGACIVSFVSFEDRDSSGYYVECFVTIGMGKILGYLFFAY